MTLKHLSDDVIQQYALEAGSGPETDDHLQQYPHGEPETDGHLQQYPHSEPGTDDHLQQSPHGEPGTDGHQQQSPHSGAETDGHLQQCPACRAKMEMYRNMAAAFRELPAPAFSFNTGALVMARLQPAPLRPARRIARLVLYAALIALLLPAGGVLYLFRHEVVRLFSGAVSILTGLAATTILTILVLQGVDMLRSHRKKTHKILQH
ncbi:anti-sigma factor family protein [Chitinophaga alhagiae]|uniref:anti-sigma factor family protein n=1 Tax=Chitinophaga alhagiae TaxID=2203219 RepID=UPI000E5ACEBF|nr:hypothetical protein [Chitinophaga alhagiae]